MLAAGTARLRTSLAGRRDRPLLAAGGGRGPLAESGLPGWRVAWYYADDGLRRYQIAGWRSVAEAVTAAGFPAGVVCRRRSGFDAVADLGFDAALLPSFATMDAYLSASTLGVLLYVNHSVLNYEPLRFHRLRHVHVGHGESEKSYMISNQVKAYDRVFVAGSAAAARLHATLFEFDPSRAVVVGRPQLSDLKDHEPRGDVAMYAPTWEGDASSAAYSSLVEMGQTVVESLLDGFSSVVYRPHPLTGTRDSATRRADRALRRLAERSSGRIRVDIATPWPRAGREVAALVADNSAVAVDFLITGRPLGVTAPTGAGTLPRELAAAAYRCSPVEAPRIGPTLAADGAITRRARVDASRAYFGDDVGIEQFVAALSELLRGG